MTDLTLPAEPRGANANANANANADAVTPDDGLPVKRRQPTLQRDWWSKSIAGTVLGFTLAMALSGVFMRVMALNGSPAGMSTQLAMWLVPPVWLTVLSFVFLFRSGWRAWGWLLAANAVVVLVL